nr:nuclear transport factor 2 family protein [Deinococcus frigens]
MERTRLKALVSGDMNTAQQLHAPEFELITPSGLRLSRDKYLDAIAAGRLKYLVWEVISEIEVRHFSDVAFIRYRSRLDVVSGDPQMVAGNVSTRPPDTCGHTDLYERRAGRLGGGVVTGHPDRKIVKISSRSRFIHRSYPHGLPLWITFAVYSLLLTQRFTRHSDQRELSTEVIHNQNSYR